MAKAEKEKLIVVESYGSITELGGISGPILNPCRVPISTIVRMVNNHRKVYEVNPSNYSERIRLTLKNVKTDNFPTPNVAVKANVSPVSVEGKKTESDAKGNETKTDTKEVKKEKSDFTKK